MERKIFSIKIINLIIIVALLCAYHVMAKERLQKETAVGTDAEQSQRSEKAMYKDGEYKGTGKGYGGDVTMQIVIKEGTITEINALSAEGEDSAYWDMAEGVIDEIIAKQDTNVDTVSGATYSSAGIINATTEALRNAMK